MSDILLEDRFGDLPLGQFSAEVGPHTEYHFLPEAAPKGNWTVACFASGADAQKAWHVVERDGARAMVQTFENKRIDTHPLVIAGDDRWRDYTFRTTFTPESDNGRIGVVFRYRNSRCYYFLGFEGSQAVLKRVRHGREYRDPVEETLASETCTRTLGEPCVANVTVKGSSITAEIEGVARLTANDDAYAEGKIGLLADGATTYHDVSVVGLEDEANRFAVLRDREQRELEELREANPKPVLWKKISTKGFGVGRNLRFGDLTGNGETDVLVAQVHHHGPRDAYSEVHCMTAMTFDGEVLWRVGEPDPSKHALTNDVGVQIHDIDNDGRNEVVYCKNFEIVILDGATGQVKHRAPTPESLPPADKFPRILGDCLFFCDLRGKGHPQDIVIKDRYWHFWVLDENLDIQWTHEIRTGHYPFAADIDGDGHDELALGHALFDHDGTLIRNIEDTMSDHIDGVAIADFQDGDGLKMLYAASDSGVFFARLDGTVLRHHWIGHGQNPAIANFRDDLPGLEVVSINFWGNQGILHFYDAKGDIYHACEPNPFGSMCLPVNWTGTGVEYFVHNPNVTYGGMFDGWGRPVVAFPDDGHPDMCNAVLDVTGDARDEVIVWDPDELWIYTQDDGPRTGRIYKPTRNAQYNNSNYQATVSLPGWTE